MYNISIIISLGSMIIALIYVIFLLKKTIGKQSFVPKKIIDLAKSQNLNINHFYKQSHNYLLSFAAIVFIATLYLFGWSKSLLVLFGAMIILLISYLSITLATKTNFIIKEEDTNYNADLSRRISSIIIISVILLFGIIAIGSIHILKNPNSLLPVGFGSASAAIFFCISDLLYIKFIKKEETGKLSHISNVVSLVANVSMFFVLLIFLVVVASIIADLFLINFKNVDSYLILLVSAFTLLSILLSQIIIRLKISFSTNALLSVFVALLSAVLFIDFYEKLKTIKEPLLDKIADPYVIAGALLGVAVSALMTLLIKKAFLSYDELMDDEKKQINILIDGSLKKTILPWVYSLIFPAAIVILMGAPAFAAFLIGAYLSNVFISLKLIVRTKINYSKVLGLWILVALVLGLILWPVTSSFQMNNSIKITSGVILIAIFLIATIWQKKDISIWKLKRSS